MRWIREFTHSLRNSRTCGNLLPRPAGAHAGRLLADEVRSWPRVLVADLDEDPAPLTSPGQGEASVELAAMQHEGQVAGLGTQHLRRSLVPDDHRAGAAHVILVHALELTGRHVVIVHRHREPADSWIERWALGHRP